MNYFLKYQSEKRKVIKFTCDHYFQNSRCSCLLMFLKCYSQKFGNIYRNCKFMRKRFRHSCFPVNIATFLKGPFSQNTFWRMLLKIQKVIRNNLKMNVQFITVLKNTICFYASIFVTCLITNLIG